jgi:hypothetical protein
MALSLLIPIVIIGSFCFCTTKAQKVSPGLYISSKGFTYDPYYEKAILSGGDSLLTAKAAFILSLVEAINQRSYPDTLRNLHRLPPAQWPPIYYHVAHLHLHAEKYPIVYARSNKLFTEEGYKLKATLIMQKIAFTDTLQKVVEFPLPASTTWREALIDSLTKYVQEL